MNNQYEHFIEHQRRVVGVYSERLHEYYNRKNQLYKIINKYKDYLVIIGFPIQRLRDINLGKSLTNINVYDYSFDDNPKYLTLRSNIYNFLKMACIKIPETIETLDFHVFLLNMPLKNFRDFYKTLNKEISKDIILGNCYNFPHNVGSVRIYRFKRDFNKRVVDRGRSNKLKAQNPDNYIVFHVDDFYNAAIYDKNLAKVPNYKFYRFKLTSFINTKQRRQLEYYDSIKSEEEILETDKVGNLQKMLAMTHFHNPKYYELYDL